MLEDTIVRRVLASALATGGHWAEVFAEDRLTHSIRLEERRIEELVTGRDRGVGVRVVRGTSSAYAFTNRTDDEGLLEAAWIAAAALRDRPGAEVRDLRRREPAVSHPVKVDPAGVERPALAEAVLRADDAARAYDPAVAQVTAAYGDARQRVYIANSQGFKVDEERVRTRFFVQVVAIRDGVVQTGFDGPGRSAGFELLDQFPPEQVAARAAERAVNMLDSRPAPAGEMPVVIGSGHGGVLFHESSGHGMEADLIAKQASVYAGRQGDHIGVAGFNGVDDATVEGGWGSFQFDDEGTPSQRTVLFEGGACTDYLTDLIRARQLGQPASGNGRRQSYADVPIPRMTNTYILPGPDDPDEILRQTRRGLYAKSLGGGQVNPVTGEFVFGVVEGYLIEHGEATVPVRGANLVGDGPGVIALMDAIGGDFDVKEGTCGKDGQGVPVGNGAPTLRIARMTVGGTGGSG
ncbi:MAG TPA: TldD/PmbA family protein [Actinomycetes bacterium]|nr:TldD/PmbA family protein [Actinomycetes bacterium]